MYTAQIYVNNGNKTLEAFDAAVNGNMLSDAIGTIKNYESCDNAASFDISDLKDPRQFIQDCRKHAPGCFVTIIAQDEKTGHRYSNCPDVCKVHLDATRQQVACSPMLQTMLQFDEYTNTFALEFFLQGLFDQKHERYERMLPEFTRLYPVTVTEYDFMWFE